MSYEIVDAEGDVIESSDESQPLEFLFGYGQVAPALERAVEGLAPGEARRTRLDPGEAFGHRDPQALVEIDRAELPDGVGVGDELSADDEEGGVVVLRVVELTGDLAVLDTNHPLAGQRVELDVVVEFARPASSEEIARAALALESAEGASRTLLPAEQLLKRTEKRPAPVE